VLYLTPFLVSAATMPLNVWTMSILSVYEVWHRSRHGARWVVPWWLLAVEFTAVIVVAIIVARRARRTQPSHQET
jgi:hypothetical protein